MKTKVPTLLFLLASITAVVIILFAASTRRPAISQSRDRRVNANSSEAPANDNANRTPPARDEVVKVDVDLVTIDAHVLQKNSARIVGGLKKEDFLLYEDGAKQEISHFSQDTLPLSVLLLIDRGGCLDPFGDKVHRAAREAVERLKPADEVAGMTYHDTTQLLQRFTRDQVLIEEALHR